MLGGMMEKLQAAQEKMEEVKARLDGITVVGEAQGVKVIVNGNKVVKNIDIPQMIIDDADKEQMEDLLLLALNRGLESAENISQAENASAMKGVIPNIPGMGF
jgi:DNA-binding YbaB/EbfC family protein|tara:strand:+ start:152 stop:460 length:309 start_codon:yes stop_codon:yes gene_type:complete